MKFIQSYELNRERWDGLVNVHGHLRQSSWFMDICAKKWCALVNEDYSKGLALAYNEVLGKKILYPAIYTRSNEPMGFDIGDLEALLDLLRKEFHIASFQTEVTLESLGTGVERGAKNFQVTDQIDLNQQAKRSLKKAEKNGIEVKKVAWKQGFHLIGEELGSKVTELNEENLERMQLLLSELEQREILMCQGIFQEAELRGVMYYIEYKNKRLYLKGACQKAVRDVGGMYLAMERAIGESLENGRYFDFGGSNLDGISRFFKSFGATDRNYHVYEWNRAPKWFNLLRDFNKRRA
ncbi:MAG: hypothetical protein EP338_11090 [Bacteroidetes bacterium]|nr:MAG: hypothetical protein EP338_11090 [Bacteroidota bacterium]